MTTSPLRPLKRYGQNFLVDQNIIRKILNALEVDRRDHILEIGPGRGSLTFPLLQMVRRLTAVEIDRGLARRLQDQASGRLDVIQGDFLRFGLKAYARRHKVRSFVVVANIPYYITTPILEKLFEHACLLRDIYVMVQKEVAERMRAPVGSKAYSAFTCFVNYFCEPRVLFRVSPGSFVPAPRVDSCFVRLTLKSGSDRDRGLKSEDLLFKVIRAAFGQRRKKLRSSLAGLLSGERLSLLAEVADLDRRAEELSLDEFKRIANLVFDILGKG